MKCLASRKTARGMTLVEVMIVIGMLLIVGLLLPQAMSRRCVNSNRIHCIANLRQICLGLRSYSNDYDEKFPWKVPPPKGAHGLDLLHTFLVASNELGSPKVLSCRSDRARPPVAGWHELTVEHISYFIALEADETRPQSILSGDRNITGGMRTNRNQMIFFPGSQVRWDTNLHNRAGNIGLADGSAQQVSGSALARQMQAAFSQLQTNSTTLVLPEE
jgi:hypothetical protein